MSSVGTTVTLRLIADVTNGKVEGDDAFEVTTIRSLENATKDSIAFYADPKLVSHLHTTAAGAMLLRSEHAKLFDGHKVIVDNPYLAYAHASRLFAPAAKTNVDHIHPSAIVAESASIHADAVIGAYCVIGENSRIEQNVVIDSHVRVGDDCVIDQHTAIAHGVYIHSRTTIGKHCNLAAGVVIGSSGFGYAEDSGKWVRIEQIGGVVIGDEVDIGANTTIDRGAIDNTVIGNGVKLDNQIQIAHNVQVGEHTIMAGCVAIAGSAVIGKRCRLGGRAAILGHLNIADDVTVNAHSFVAKSITKSGVYSSMIPVQPAAEWRKTVANIHRLESLANKIQNFATKPAQKSVAKKK